MDSVACMGMEGMMPALNVVVCSDRLLEDRPLLHREAGIADPLTSRGGVQ